MAKEVLSTFKEKPKLKITWWAMGLGLVMIFSGPILGISAALLVPWLSKTISEKAASTIGFSMIIVMLGIMIAALITGIGAYLKGERSWAMWIGLIPAIIACLFWIFMLVGEFIFPH